VINNKIQTYYICPQCQRWLVAEKVSGIWPLYLLFGGCLLLIYLFIGMALYALITEYVCSMSLLFVLFVLIFAFLWENVGMFAYSHRMTLWQPVCMQCSYDMRALLVDSKCPECGGDPQPHPGTLVPYTLPNVGVYRVKHKSRRKGK
jgi:predicted RNA-binding Zn-ribbon protein involved in translation (DUF1610 family)